MNPNDEHTMTSNQPYMLRAFYDWIVDNDLTPHLVVDASLPNVFVPTQFVQDGQIVLNVSPSACVNFALSPDGIFFQARFGGKPYEISMPCQAVLAIYARENGAGTVFAPEDRDMGDSTQETGLEAVSEVTDNDIPIQEENQPVKPKGKPTLTVVK